MPETATTKTAIALSLLSWLQWTAQPVNGHFVLTYPGWRGNTLKTTEEFPNGMQWNCPCGGIPSNQNSTLPSWPTTGGAVALQPGWFKGHGRSTIWINLIVSSSSSSPSSNTTIGLTTRQTAAPQTIPLAKLRVTSPKGAADQNPFPGTLCMPYLPLPANLARAEGEQGTIQVIQSHEDSGTGGAYNCMDVVFTGDEDAVLEVNEGNCFNMTGIKVEMLLGGEGQAAGTIGSDGLLLEENDGDGEKGGYCLKPGKPTTGTENGESDGKAAETSGTVPADNSSAGSNETSPAPAETSQSEEAGSSKLLVALGKEAGLGLVGLWAVIYLY